MDKKIQFLKDEIDKNHFRELSKKVKQELKKIPSKRIIFSRFRAVFFPIVYVFLYFLSTKFYQQPIYYFSIFGLMGLTVVLIFLNLVHDAVHESIFKNKNIDRTLLYFFDLIGANSYIWKIRHKLLHHRYQNIAGWDSDIAQASIMRIFPHDKKEKVHTIQHRLIFIFYPIYLLNWLFIRDFKDFFQKNQIVSKVVKIPTIEYIKLIFFKLFYIFYIVIIPILNGVSVGKAIGAMVFMVVVAGLFALTVLLPPHANISNEFPLPNDDGELDKSWLKHQFETTNDVSLNNWFSRNLMGNFNFHVVHHLFPTINSSLTPEATKIVKEYADLNGFSYKSLTLKEALLNHYKLLKFNAKES